MGTTPLKLEGTNGDLKEMTTTEENYLAYQAGLHLSALDSSDVATITQVSTDNTIIGTHTDTTFDDGPGTHGFSGGNVPVVSTTTSLYQREGVTDLRGDSSGYRYPIEFINNGGTYEIHEFDSSELDTISDRLVSRIYASEYPGVYRLASSSPGGDWSVYKSGVFEDRLQTGSSGTVYNLYVKSSMTPPTAVRPMSIKRSAGATGTYEGLQEMTDAEIRYTFGAKAQSRIMNGTGGIGTYQLRSSAQGAPTDTGTWTAKGSATDSRYDLVNTDYSATYTRDRTSTYTGNYSRDFSQSFTRTRSSNYLGNYVGNFVGNYSRDFLGDYTGNYSRDFAGNYTGNYSRTFAGNYVGNYAREFSADYTRTRITDYIGDFTGNYTGNYSRDFAGNYTRNDFDTYVGDFVGNYANTFTRTRATNYQRTSTRTRVTDYVGNFVGNYARTRATTYTGDFVGNYVSGAYAYARTRVTNYVGNFVGNYARTRVTTYTGNFAGNFVGDYVGDFVGNYSNTFTRTSTRGSVVSGANSGTYSNANNLLLSNFGSWTTGTGSTTGYNQNGDGNSRISDTSPKGTDIVWDVSNQDATSDADGGWNSSNFNIDRTKTYRFSVWVRRKTIGNGSFYLGVGANTVNNRTDGVQNSNPYFQARGWWDASSAGQWFLVVGHVYSNASGTGGVHPDSGIYNASGEKVVSAQADFYWTSSVTQTYHRTYLYYSTDTSTNQQFWEPRVEDIDAAGTPTIAQLVGNSPDYTRTRSSSYSDDYTRNSVTTFTGDFVGNYVGNYSRNFEADYTRDRSSTYSADYTRTRTSTYSADYQRTRVSTYTRDTETDFTRTTTEDFIGNYLTTRTSAFTRTSSTTFTGNYLGNYVGTTIDSTTSTIETYTLYVRTA